MDNVIVKTITKNYRSVFAARDFKKGELILNLNGKILTKDELFKLSRYINDHCGIIGPEKYIIFGYPEKYINHSCEPNVFDKNRKVIAMKDIKKGDELSYDYSIAGVDNCRMNCHCKTKNCRKIIQGYKSLPNNVREMYKRIGLIPKYLLELEKQESQ